MLKICTFCGKEYDALGSTSKYCSNSCRGKAYRQRKANGVDGRQKICLKCGKSFYITDQGYNRRYCYECLPENTSVNRNIIKQWALEYKGNKCQCCGYDKCLEALEFHHLDEDKKLFNISDKDTSGKSWTEIQKELDKCILICANCHREIHAGVREI